jgi:hypothetical protein
VADFGVQSTPHYAAFISYSHADAPFARRLHQRLESYRLPRKLGALPGLRNDASRRLRPIFRDREDFTAAPDLTDAIRHAIGEAGHMIVVCTPASATSTWVGREVAFCRAVHGDGAILAALVDGNAAGSLHPALLAAGPGDGAGMPLAADFGRHGDGPRLALLKLVAVLAGVRLDALVQRDAQRRIRQVTITCAAALLGMAAMAILAVLAVNARAAAERERARGATLIEYLLKDLRGHLQGVGRLDLLAAVNQGALAYYQGQNLSYLSDDALMDRAKLLRAMAGDDEKRGKFADAVAEAEEALRTTTTLLKARPADQTRIYEQAQSEYLVGFIKWRMKNLAEAEAHWQIYAALAGRLMRMDPANPTYAREVGYANANLGTVVFRRWYDLTRAERLFQDAVAGLRAAQALLPHDAGIEGAIADDDGWLGDIARMGGNDSAAYAYRTDQKRVLEDMLTADPRNADIRTDLIANTLAFARLDANEHQFDKAVGELKAGREAAQAQARDDPDNADLKRKARIFDLFLARTWLSMPKANQPPDQELVKALGDCDILRDPPGAAAGFTGACGRCADKTGDPGVARRRAVGTAQQALGAGFC